MVFEIGSCRNIAGIDYSLSLDSSLKESEWKQLPGYS